MANALAKRHHDQAEAKQYKEWLARVEPEEKAQLAAIVEKNPIRGYDDLLLLSGALHAEVLRGRLPPGLAKCCLEFMTFQFRAVGAIHDAMRTPEERRNDVLAAVAKAAVTANAISDVGKDLLDQMSRPTVTIDAVPETAFVAKAAS